MRQDRNVFFYLNTMNDTFRITCLCLRVGGEGQRRDGGLRPTNGIITATDEASVALKTDI